MYVHMYACMYVRVCVIGMKPINVYIKMFTMGHYGTWKIVIISVNIVLYIVTCFS